MNKYLFLIIVILFTSGFARAETYECDTRILDESKLVKAIITWDSYNDRYEVNLKGKTYIFGKKNEEGIYRGISGTSQFIEFQLLKIVHSISGYEGFMSNPDKHFGNDYRFVYCKLRGYR